MALVLDLEAVAADGVEQFLDTAKAPANFKDPEKIAAYIAEARQEQMARAALDPWLARIVCLGWMNDDGKEIVITCMNEAQEATALRSFWKECMFPGELYVRPIVGFNHLGYDLPVMLARSLLLDVKAPGINLNRFKTPHIDLIDRLSWYEAKQRKSLRFYARRFGLPVDDPTTGKDIAALVAAGNWDAVAAHNLSDLRLTKALAERLNLIKGMKVAA